MKYFIYGSDQYRAKEKVKEIQAKYEGFSVEKIVGEKISLNEFSSKIKSASLFSPKRLLIVENLSVNDGQKEVADFLKEQEEILDSANDIFVFVEEKIDKKTSLYKFLNNFKDKWEMENLSGVNLKRWISDYIKDKKGEIEEKAMQEILAGGESNLYFLSLELDKLLAYDNKITLANVYLLTVANFDENIFNLTDAIGAGDRVRALGLMSNQLEKGLEPFYLLTMIIRQFRILMQIKEASLRQNDYGIIAKNLGLHPFVVQKTIKQVKSYSFLELEKKYEELQKIDLALKSSKVSAEVWLTRFVIEE